ncbi:MAG TPA: DNA-deoxyinosine glycosylase [Novosphingobium sp.]|nr:DNA-deoxyinosine glycosylase [Novosphingobium sp.]
MTRSQAFAPICPPETRLLILGSLPGVASLAAGRYYAHPRNLFWTLLGPAIGRAELQLLTYDERLSALAAARIGLWDAIASAERHGSLDTAIRAAQLAALLELVARLPELRAVAFNGAKAAAVGRGTLAGTTLALIDLPSSSPAYAAMPFAEKRRRWSALKEFLV